MKNFSFPLFFLLSLIFLTSCSTEDDVIEPETPTEIIGHSFSLKIDGSPHLDYSSLSAVSLQGRSTINENGEFELGAENEDAQEEIPFLITKNDEILFGYYPWNTVEGEVTLEDILLFFFSMHPDIGIRGWETQKLLSEIRKLSDKETLEVLISESLNENKSPLENTELISLFKKNVKLIITGEKRKTANKEYIQDFKFTYKRNGTVEIPTTIPLFAAVGVEIENMDSDEFLVQNYIMNSNSLVLNTTSLSSWIGNKLFPETAPPASTTFQFITDGAHEIKFTNGRGTSELDNYVKARNYQYFATTVLGQVIPKGLKTLYRKNDKCFKAVLDLNVQLKTDFGLFVAYPPTDEQIYGLIRKNIINTAEIMVACAMEGSLKAYFSLILDYGLKKLDAIKEASELVFFSRDFFGSEISDKETRYYSNGISFGPLDMENISGNEFKGEKGKAFTYEAFHKEEKVWYEVHRSGLSSSEFKRKTGEFPAAGLPFMADLIKGDATIIDNTAKTSSEGILKIGMEMGVDSSEVMIKPSFKSSMISPEKIKLEPANPLIGIWKSDTWKGEPLGTQIPTYMVNCPNIVQFFDYMFTNTLEFYEDTYTVTTDSKFVSLQRQVDSNCEIIKDEPDYTDREVEVHSQNYTFIDNIITITDDEGNEMDSTVIEFLNDEKTRFIFKGDKYKDVWVKQ